MLSPIRCRVACELHQCRFRGAVPCGIPFIRPLIERRTRCDHRVHRAGIDDAAGFFLLHAGEDRLHRDHRPEDSSREIFLEVFERRILQLAIGNIEPRCGTEFVRIVDQHVDRPRVFHRLGESFLERGSVVHINRIRADLFFAEFLREFIARCHQSLGSPHHQDLRARLEQPSAHRATQKAGGAGEEDYFAVEGEGGGGHWGECSTVSL